jgi:tetratricopeptide (TPR) repeat protein
MPDSVCQKCGSSVSPSDKFCGVCGEPLKKAGGNVCSSCGQSNSAGAQYCESCGAALKADPAAPAQKAPKAAAKPAGAPAPLRSFQSGKFVAGLAVGIALVVIVAIFVRNNSQPKAPDAPPSATEEVRALQAELEQNPKNDKALLRLGNLYYDAKEYPRAIMLYTRYLEITPSDADVRVDLGTSYFELAMGDSTRRTEYFAEASKEMQKALTYAPKHQLACFNLGMVSLHSGDMVKANEWFRKCVEINPTSEAGQRAQQLINQFNHPPS